MLVRIDEVKINMDRHREATGNMDALAQSLLIYGQLQPIVLDDQMYLLAGFRRYTAMRMNGAQEIEAVTLSNINPILAKEIELEENIQREQLTWQERTFALAQLDKLKKELNPNWSQDMTAQLVGKYQRDVSTATQLGNAMALFPELKEAKSVNQAMSWLKAKASQIVRTAEVRDNAVAYQDIEPKIILGDSVEVIKSVPDETFHAIITDPPFGIDYGDRKAGTEGTLNSYEDGEASYRRLLSMAPDLYRTIKPNGWLVWFLGMSWYEEAKHAFRFAGFTVDELPIIWDRTSGRCHTNRPDHYFTRGYDAALHCFKGDPQIIKRGLPNVLHFPPVSTEDRDLIVERPIELYEELLHRLTVPGELVADFFVGSGSCPAACAKTKRDYFGVEQDPERRAVAIQKIKAWTPSE